MEISEIRKANLKWLAKEQGSANLARKLGYSQPSYITQMVGPNANRPLTEKNARRYEQQLDLPSMWFDQVHDSMPSMESPPSAIELALEVIKLVGKVAENEALILKPARFSDLVVLAYEDGIKNGAVPRENYIQSLVRLMK